MGKFIIASFLILGWAFYEASGGADFEPETRFDQIAGAESVGDTQVEVTRAATSSLMTINLPVTSQSKIVQATATVEVNEASTETVATEINETAILTETVAAPTVVTEPTLDLRLVAGSRVNMRSGPGTDYNVLDTVSGGTEAEVLSVNADGWANIRIISTNQQGWMAERLLSDG